MIIVGENLRQLIRQAEICQESNFDEHSISLSLDHTCYIPRPSTKPIRYNQQCVDEHFDKLSIPPNGLDLKPGQALLACSFERIQMPSGYFGLLQTKGSLARIFCTTNMCDGQIEPGFCGKITLEIVNHGPFSVTLFGRDRVAQLFLLQCSTANSRPYNGRYNNADAPTLMRMPL